MKDAIRLRIRWIVRLMIRFMGMLFLSFWVIAFFHQSVPAGEIRVYTLDECVKEALRNNWELKAKKEQIDQAEYVKNQARARVPAQVEHLLRLQEVRLKSGNLYQQGPF